MRVALFEPLGRGGLADYTGELATALAVEGAKVELITATDHLYGASPGVDVVGAVPWLRAGGRLGTRLRRAHLGGAANGLRFLAALPRIVRRARRAEVVHVQGFYFPPLLALAMVLLRAGGLPLVHTPHNTFDRGRAHPLARRVMSACAARTLVHAQADLQALRDARRAVVIPHGEYGGVARAAPAASRAEARRRIGAGGNEIVVLLYGQLRPDKGIPDLLAAAAAVPATRVVLAGEDLGGLSGCERLLAAPELRQRVIVLRGFQEAARTSELFAAADVVALPYRRASQSGVLLLAYGFARPVVVYPVGGLPEAVRDGETGWVCTAPDPEALRDVLAQVAREGHAECERRGSAGRALAEEEYSWAAIARRTLDVYAAVRA